MEDNWVKIYGRRGMMAMYEKYCKDNYSSLTQMPDSGIPRVSLIAIDGHSRKDIPLLVRRGAG
jgi:hypothetical protein